MMRSTKYISKISSLFSLLLTIFCSLHTGPVWAGVVYYHPDHLGSSNILTDENGTVVGETNYYPYGDIFSDSGSSLTHYKFTDQESDEETGLVYYGARYYDPVLGKFLSPDPLEEPLLPQDLNPYQYARGNPLKLIDPDGEEEIEAHNFLHLGRRFVQRGRLPSWGDMITIGSGENAERFMVLNTKNLERTSGTFHIEMVNMGTFRRHSHGVKFKLGSTFYRKENLSPVKKLIYFQLVFMEFLYQRSSQYQQGAHWFLEYIDSQGNVIEWEDYVPSEALKFVDSPPIEIGGMQGILAGPEGVLEKHIFTLEEMGIEQSVTVNEKDEAVYFDKNDILDIFMRDLQGEYIER